MSSQQNTIAQVFDLYDVEVTKIHKYIDEVAEEEEVVEEIIKRILFERKFTTREMFYLFFTLGVYTERTRIMNKLEKIFF